MAEITGFIKGDASGFLGAVASARVALVQFRDLARRTGPQVAQGLDSAAQGARRLRSEFSRASTAARNLGSASTRASSDLNRTRGRVERLERSASSLRVGITGLAGSFLLFRGFSFVEDAIRSAITLTREVERATAEVATLVDTTRVPIERITEGAREVTRAFGFEAVDSIKAAYQAISAGVDPAKVVGFLGENAKLAVAGLTTLAKTVDVTTSVINAYGFEVEKVGLVSDVLFQTVKDGKVTLDDLVGSIGRAVPIAANTGVSFLDLSAAIATTTKGGLNARESVTGLRQVFKSIAKPTDDAKAAASALGIEFNATALRTKGFADFIRELKASLDEAEKQGFDTREVLNQLFGNIRALNAVLPLVGTQFDTFNKSVENTRKATEATDKAARTITLTFDRQLQIAFATISDVVASVGQDFAKLGLDILGVSSDAEKSRSSLELFAKATKAAAKGPINEARAAVKLLRGDFEGLSEILGENTGLFSSLTESVSGFAANVTGFVVPAIGSFIDLSGQSAAKTAGFIEELDKLSDLTGKTGIELALERISEQLSIVTDKVKDFLTPPDFILNPLRTAIRGVGRDLFGISESEDESPALRDRREAEEARRQSLRERSAFGDALREQRRRKRQRDMIEAEAARERAFEEQRAAMAQARFLSLSIDERIEFLRREQEAIENAKRVQDLLIKARRNGTTVSLESTRAERERQELEKQRQANLTAFAETARLVDSRVEDVRDALSRLPVGADDFRKELEKQLLDLRKIQEQVNATQGQSAKDANKVLTRIRLGLRDFDVNEILDEIADKVEKASIDARDSVERSTSTVVDASRRGKQKTDDVSEEVKQSADRLVRGFNELDEGLREGSRITAAGTKTLAQQIQDEFNRLFRSPLGVVGTRRERDNLLKEISGEAQRVREANQRVLDRIADSRAEREQETIDRLKEFRDSLESASEVVQTQSFGLETPEEQRRARRAFIEAEEANRAAARRLGVPLGQRDLINPSLLFDQLLRSGGVDVFRAQRGGVVPGTGSGDKVPALLEPGERVVRKEEAPFVGAILQALRSSGGSPAAGTTLSIQNLTLNVDVRGQGGTDIADGVVRRLVRLTDLGQVDQMARF